MQSVDWKNDLKASLVVFLVALPLCLGIALASNAPLAAGLISGMVGGIVIGFFSGSGISVSGPAAGLTVIVAAGIAEVGGFKQFGLAVLLAGLLQILFGLLRGGVIGDYFPTAVIKGMLAAIGLILILKQYPNTLGSTGIIIISIVSLAIMLGWEKLAQRGYVFFKFIPGALVAVAVSILINYLYHAFFPSLILGQAALVQLPFTGGFAPIFEGVNLPDFSLVLNPTMLKISFTIAIVASLETLLCLNAADRMDPLKRKTSKDRELFAQGIGNAVSGVLGGLPLTAVIVRTTANVTAGATSKVSSIFHGFWIIFCVALIPGVLNMIPLASLACVLLLVGYKLTKPEFFVDMQKRGNDQLFIFCATIAAIIFTDLLVGIGIGLAVAIFFELRSPALSCVEEIHEKDKVTVIFNRNASFFHKARIHKMLNDIPVTKTVHIKGLKNVRVHIDVHDVIYDYHDTVTKKGMVVIIDK